jgi:hypothetical protein
MNFDQYMAKKIESKPTKPQRKSISPIRDEHTATTLKIADLKSRSCSPLSKKPEKTDRSLLVTQKKQKPQQPLPHSHVHSHVPPHLPPQRNPRENK